MICSRRPGRGQSGGFTLFEMIITMALLALGVAPVMQALSTGVVVEQGVEGRVIALALAQEKIEQIKNAAWVDLPGLASDRGSVGGDFAAYEREVFIAGEGSDPSNLKKITVNVHWTTNGSDQSVSLVTLLANLSPQAQ